MDNVLGADLRHIRSEADTARRLACAGEIAVGRYGCGLDADAAERESENDDPAACPAQ
ncbi:MAG TPA: hypothetical protein VGH27_04965 [Streptosporangiaceae bacterium]